MPMHDIDLPAGYSIAEGGVPGVPPKHQVLRGSGRDQQLIGVRDNREEATQLAIRDNDRVQAERAAARSRRPGRDRAVRR
jgi:hypothetical protein